MTPLGVIKLCGIRSVADALAALEAGADEIGVILAPGYRRSIDVDTAVSIRAAIDTSTHRPQLVGVVVDESPATIRGLVHRTGIDAVQLAGQVTLARVQAARDSGARVDGVFHAPQYCAVVPDRYLAVDRLVIDAVTASGAAGGTGQPTNLDTVRALASLHPCTVAAGGLRVDTVRAVASIPGVRGVDVSSGIEHDGRKDPALMARFVTAARAGFTEVRAVTRTEQSA